VQHSLSNAACARSNATYRSLKRELVRAQEEIKRIQSVPLVIGQFMEAIDQKYQSLPLSEQVDEATDRERQHWNSTVFDRLELRRPHPLYP